MTERAGGESAAWDAAIEEYHWDRVVEAHALAEPMGVGETADRLAWYRLLEAEAITRRKSKVVQLRDWLSFEWIPSEVEDLAPRLQNLAIEACDEIAERLGWSHGPPCRIAILAPEVDAPWATHPYGYCADMYPYDKICLPDHLIDDLDEFSQAVAHEYAHVISLNLALGHAPRWLEEAVSVLAEREFDREAWDAFREDPAEWQAPSDLEAAFETVEEDEDAEWDVWLAYQQSGWIGRYLESLDSGRKLGDLLRAHADERLLLGLSLAIAGRTRTDYALKKTYGLTLRRLFDEAYAFTIAQPPLEPYA